VARAVASVVERFPVVGGTYRVTLTYAGIHARRREQGSDVRARVRRRSTAEFVSRSDTGGDSGVRRVQRLPGHGSATTVLLLDTGPGTRGRIVVTADLYARSAATGAADHAVATGAVRDVRITCTRVS
ncbi:MAG: hypothetical protein JWN84_718, partial [Nocardioides sp.]|nr:hypothetical protein [Nocardioides sp.]